MDRQVVYPGSIPLDTDLLHMQRNVMTAVGLLARCVLGTETVADGLACRPAAAGYGVIVGPGSLSTLYVTDARPFGSLAADTTPLMQIGYNASDTAVLIHGPADGDHALCWLIQAAIVEYDAGPVALSYYNAADPAVAWSGPLNSGVAQNTQRVVRIALSAKPGEPRIVGGRFPPLADVGWVGLYSVMTYFGQATKAVDIAVSPGGPFLPFKLPALLPGFSRQEVFSQNTIWVAPPDVRSAKVRLVGAGGGGGGGDFDYAGGGGGAGGYAEAIVPVEPGGVVVVTVGVGGAGGAPRYNGVVGGSTSFGTLVAASNGLAGARAIRTAQAATAGAGRSGRCCCLVGQAGMDRSRRPCRAGRAGPAHSAAGGVARSLVGHRHKGRRRDRALPVVLGRAQTAAGARMAWLSLSINGL